MLLKKIFLCLGFVFCIRILFAQAPDHYIIAKNYEKALDLYDHGKLSPAGILFHKVYEGEDLSENFNLKQENENPLKINARFYAAFCDLELHFPGSDKPAFDLIAAYPSSPLVYTTYFHLGNYYFFNHDYVKCFMNLEKADQNHLTPDQLDELNFHIGYSYFAVNRYESAQIYFTKLTDHKGEYQEDAIYYSGHLSFAAKDYYRALAQFNALKPNGKYSDIKPIYVNQIYLIQGRYNLVIDSGKAVLTKHKGRHSAEMNRLVGSAYFFKKDFASAAPYFEEFKKDTSVRKENTQNRYQIGFTYYKTGQYEKAIQELLPLTKELDAYAQNGLYVLGLCYLKTDKKMEARNAFRQATSIPGDDEVTENALAYYVRVTAAMGLNQEALPAARSFSEHYPNSPNIGEIRTLEGEILISSKKYPEAYQTLKSIQNRSVTAEAAFQKAAYYNGLEQYNQDHFSSAKSFLEEAIAHPQDKGLLALSHYWEGENLYQTGAYDQALDHYQTYFNLADKSSAVYSDALYGQAYGYFKKQNYTKALSLFQKYQSRGIGEKKLAGDVQLRIADCYFMLREFSKAGSIYKQQASDIGEGQDYSLFQSATILGLQNDNNGKIKSLQSLLSRYPTSGYADQAQFEIASAYLKSGNTDQAQQEFKKLIQNYPSSSLSPKSMLNLGLIYFNNNQDDQALNQYKEIVSRYPGTPEAKSALSSIKNIYVQKNDPSGFLNYASGGSGNAISQNAQDSTTFQTANQQYIQGNYQASIQSYTFYLEKFPKGNFSNEAHYNRAKALEKLGRLEETQADYAYLSGSGNNKYQEEAELKLSALYLKGNDYAKALPVLQNLTQNAQETQDYGYGIEGQLIVYNSTSQPDSALLYAKKLKEFSKSTPFQLEEAGLYGAKAFLAKGDTLSAESYLEPLVRSSRSILGAEARYHTAEIQYARSNYKGSQKILFDLIKQMASYDYWVAKSFVLLADNYLAMNDPVQARATLQSLVDHYNKEDDVKKIAREKLSKIQTGK